MNAVSLAEVLVRPDVWRGAAATAGVPVVHSGFAPLDAELPGGGGARGRGERTVVRRTGHRRVFAALAGIGERAGRRALGGARCAAAGCLCAGLGRPARSRAPARRLAGNLPRPRVGGGTELVERGAGGGAVLGAPDRKRGGAASAGGRGNGRRAGVSLPSRVGRAGSLGGAAAPAVGRHTRGAACRTAAQATRSALRGDAAARSAAAAYTGHPA